MRRIPLSAIIGMILTGAFILSALLADFIAPYGMAEVVGDVWEPISADHWFGTDTIGRDMLTRMIYGGQTTILVAAAATMISFGTGSVFGFLAATMGGWVYQAMSGLIIFRGVLPNGLSAVVAELGLRFIFAVLFISTLSFLGLGVQPPLADWGGIVKENSAGLVYGKSAALIPAFAIAALAISVNLVADWVLSRTTSLKGGRGA